MIFFLSTAPAASFSFVNENQLCWVIVINTIGIFNLTYSTVSVETPVLTSLIW